MERRVRDLLLSALLFVAVRALFITALSKQMGRLTFGHSGRLAYASMVSPGNYTPVIKWQ
jgi:hypothetical protein